MTCDEENLTWHVGDTYCSFDALVYMQQADHEVGHGRKHVEEEGLPLQNDGGTGFVCGEEGHLTWDCLSANYDVEDEDEVDVEEVGILGGIHGTLCSQLLDHGLS